MSTRVLRKALLSSALVGVFSIPAANAAQVTDTFQVTATVEAECEVSATDLNFGTIDLQTDNDSTTTVSYRCTAGTVATIGLTYGTMSNGGTGTLAYGLFQNDTGTPWDDSANTQVMPAATGFNNLETATVYGTVTSAQAQADGVEVGNYSDTVTVTLEF
jgi:spore coat protein U-like protein